MDALGDKLAIGQEGLQEILDGLANRGYRVIGPTMRDGAIIYENIARLEDLPIGWTERQDAGQYRLDRRADQAIFGYAVGPHSWKRFLHPPEEILWTAERNADGVTIAVLDEGPGIDEGDEARIFERFYRADSARASSDGGTGLGLAIAQWIVDLHGGDIHPERREPHGCRMVVTLPSS